MKKFVIWKCRKNKPYAYFAFKENQSRYSNVPSILVVPNKTTLEYFSILSVSKRGGRKFVLSFALPQQWITLFNRQQLFGLLFVCLQGKSGFGEIYGQQRCLTPLFQYIVYYLLPHISPRVKYSVQCLYSYMQCKDYFSTHFKITARLPLGLQLWSWTNKNRLNIFPA